MGKVAEAPGRKKATTQSFMTTARAGGDRPSWVESCVGGPKTFHPESAALLLQRDARDHPQLMEATLEEPTMLFYGTACFD